MLQVRLKLQIFGDVNPQNHVQSFDVIEIQVLPVIVRLMPYERKRMFDPMEDSPKSEIQKWGMIVDNQSCKSKFEGTFKGVKYLNFETVNKKVSPPD